MAWEHLSINKPHLVYLILGGFTTLFMLCSSIIKERLYIGEATVATICGIIFGPHAADLINPATWGNVDQITIEFSRIVLVVQCFAVGVELPRAYMERHWRSVVFLLVPVMTFGWLITSLFIWGLLHDRLDWLDSLVIAACVTATDPVLASSVVGKGKFAKRVPKHLRDLLSAESGCNDGMAFPFVYLAIYLVDYRPDANEVSLNWFCITILYECVFGAIYGVAIGYIARRAVRYAHERDLIDRESFLVFYFVLALFCAGSGSLLGMDDLLVGFACGVGFSNDGWFLEKTEESHVSNVIDLLINLAFFVYLGTIIPWEQYNSELLGLTPWKLVVLALLVLFFRRIPIMLLLKPVIPDIKTWREALFAGHFGPIGVGAIFVAILARAEMEGHETTPLAALPGFDAPHAHIVYLVWPIVTFLVLASILVHGSSIAVFTLGKRINTLTITMSYTQAADEGNWMDRLPRIQSRSRTSASKARSDASDDDIDEEKMGEYPAGSLPRNFLRRQKEGETPGHSRATSKERKKNRRRWSGGPIEDSAIRPRPRKEDSDSSRTQQADSPEGTLAMQSESSNGMKDDEPPGKHKSRHGEESETEVYEEGGDTVIEDEEGNVLEVMKSREGETDEERQRSIEEEIKNLMSDEDVEDGVAQKEQGIQSGLHMDEVAHGWKDHNMKGQEGNELEGHGHPPKDGSDQRKPSNAPSVDHKGESGLKAEMSRMKSYGQKMLGGMKRDPDTHPEKEGPPQAERPHHHRQGTKRGPAHAYRIGRTIIVEDEDGEVIKQYDIPAPEKPQKQGQSHADPDNTRQRLTRMGTWLGIGKEEARDAAENGMSSEDPSKKTEDVKGKKKKKPEGDDDDDERVRFTVNGSTRRMNRADFIRQLTDMDPKTRAKVVEQSDAPKEVKEEARADAKEHIVNKRKASAHEMHNTDVKSRDEGNDGKVKKISSKSDKSGPDGLTLLDSNNQAIPFHNFSPSSSRGGATNSETAAQRRRRQATRTSTASSGYFSSHAPQGTPEATIPEELDIETPPQRTAASTEQRSTPKRRDDSDSDDDGTERVPPVRRTSHQNVTASTASSAHRTTSSSNNGGSEETAAERRRREGALGVSREDSDSDDDKPRRESKAKPKRGSVDAAVIPEEEEPMSPEEGPRGRAGGIRFADPTPRQQQERERHERYRQEVEREVAGDAEAQQSAAARAPADEESEQSSSHHGHGDLGLGRRLKWAAGLGKKK